MRAREIHDIELFESNIWTGTAKQLVQLLLPPMATVTSFDSTYIAGLAAEKYFAVNL